MTGFKPNFYQNDVTGAGNKSATSADLENSTPRSESNFANSNISAIIKPI